MPTAVPPEPGEITRLLASARAGDRDALDRLLPLVYDELRGLAGRELRREHGPVTLNPTDLVHEAYLRMAGNAPPAANRAHFLALAARVMRQIMVDQARRRRAQKRGGGAVVTTLGDREAPRALDDDALLALEDALETLEPRQQQVVEYRFFGGLDEEAIAEVLGVSARTVRRDWVKARAWLYRELYSPEAS